jgi:hypothetical protein
MSRTTGPSWDTSSVDARARAERRRATWTITRYRNPDEMKAAEYRYWAGRPAYERLAAVAELSREAYAMKGVHVQELRGALVRLRR